MTPPRDGSTGGLTIARERLINKIKGMGFSYWEDSPRVSFFRRSGDEKIVSVPKRDRIAEEAVRPILKMIGCSKEDIDGFVQAAVN